MKKALLKLMCLVIGLNVFTACYGPAPYPEEDADLQGTEQNAETKAGADEAVAETETAETPENA